MHRGGGFVRHGLGFGEGDERLGAAVVEAAAGVGEAETPRRALEQAHAEPRLERGDAAADRGLRPPEPPRAAREAARLDDGEEELRVRDPIRHRRRIHARRA